MNIPQMFASAIVRRIAFVVVAAAFAWFAGIGDASAQTTCTKDGPYTNCTQQSAIQSCIARSSQLGVGTYYTYVCGYGQNAMHVRVCGANPSPTNNARVGQLQSRETLNAICYTGDRDWYWNTAGQCPNGWDPVGNKCAPSQAECLARPAATSGWTLNNGGHCSDACSFGPAPAGETFTVNGKTYRSMAGSVPTGAACVLASTNEPLPPAPQYCEPVGTLTMCLKQNGEHCASASTGKQICWKPGETGEKTDGPILQSKVAGPNEIPPQSLTLPNGDSLTKSAGPATTTSTKGGTTTTTTTTNYVTTHGTNAGGGTSGSGEPADGTGGGDGEGDGEGNGSTGGVTCDAPPVSTGDALLAQIAHQQWLARCTGSGEEFDGDHGEGVVDGKTGWDDTVPDETVLDEAGFLGGAGSCPSPPTFTLGGTSRTIDTSGLCDLGDIIAALMLLAAFAHAAYILAGNR